MLIRTPRQHRSEVTPPCAPFYNDELLRYRRTEQWEVSACSIQSHRTPRFPKSSHGSAIQMDVVSHCVEALRFIAGLSDSQIQDIGFELALVGRQGFDTTSTVKRYRFAGVPILSFSSLEALVRSVASGYGSIQVWIWLWIFGKSTTSH